MPQTDMFAYTVEKLGPPAQASRVPFEEAARYADRLPPALIGFWQTYGRGSYQDGKFWICDPAPFQPVIEAVFYGDPEFDPADMTAIGYSAFASLKIWHRRRRAVSIDFLFREISNPPASAWHDPDTGEPFSPDFSIGCQLTSFQYTPAQVDNDGVDLLPQAIARLGRLTVGELYGFIPALNLGGDYRVENLRRLNAAEHLLVIAETANFTLTRLTPPEPPAHPYGRIMPVRTIGRM